MIGWLAENAFAKWPIDVIRHTRWRQQQEPYYRQMPTRMCDDRSILRIPKRRKIKTGRISYERTIFHKCSSSMRNQRMRFIFRRMNGALGRRGKVTATARTLKRKTSILEKIRRTARSHTLVESTYNQLISGFWSKSPPESGSPTPGAIVLHGCIVNRWPNLRAQFQPQFVIHLMSICLTWKKTVATCQRHCTRFIMHETNWCQCSQRYSITITIHEKTKQKHCVASRARARACVCVCARGNNKTQLKQSVLEKQWND